MAAISGERVLAKPKFRLGLICVFSHSVCLRFLLLESDKLAAPIFAPIMAIQATPISHSSLVITSAVFISNISEVMLFRSGQIHGSNQLLLGLVRYLSPTSGQMRWPI